MRRFLATLMALIMLISVLSVSAETAQTASTGRKLLNETYTQPISEVENLEVGYAVLLRDAEICSDQQLKEPVGAAEKGDIVYAQSRKGYGTANDRVKVAWACKGEARTGWVAAKHLRLMDKQETKTYLQKAEKNSKAVRYSGKFLLNIAAYKAETVARATLPATAITSLKTTSGGLNIKWKAVEGATKYQVFRSTKKSSGFKRIATVTTNTYVDASAKRNTGYYYYIKAIGADGATSQSATKGRYNEFGPTVKFKRATNGNVTISWAAKKNAVSYALYRADEGSTSYKKIATIKDGATSYVDKSTANGKTYSYYAVANYKVNGNVSITGSQGARKSYTYGVTKPADLAAANVAGGVKLTWSAVENATGYRVFYRVGASGTWTQLKTTAATAKAYTHTAPAYGEAIQYSVRTQGKHNGKTVYAPHTIINHVAVGQPTATIAKSGTGEITVSWSAAKGATGYSVVLKGENGAEYTADVAADAERRLVFAVEDDGDYSATVQAYCSLEGAMWYGRVSNTASTAIELVAPAMTLSTASRGWVTVSWNAVPGAEQYRIFYKKSTDSAFNRLDVDSAEASVKLPAANNTAYKVYMCAVNGDGEGPVCATQTITPAWTSKLSAPTLTVTKGDKGVLNLSWTALSKASGYMLYYKESGAAAYTKAFFDKDTLSYALSVTPESTYSLYVCAYEGDVSEPYAGKSCAVQTILATWIPVLDKPMMTVEQGTYYKLNVNWQPVAEATRYRIFYKKESASGFSNVIVEGGDTTSYALTVENDTTYVIYMRAVHVDEDGTTTSGPTCARQTVSVHWDEPSMPTPELTVTPVAGDPGVTTLEIAWTVPDDEWHYLLAVREEGEETFDLRDVTDKQGGPIIWDVATGTVMEFRMEAFYPVENMTFWCEPTEIITLLAAYGYYALVEPTMQLTLGDMANELLVSWEEQAFATHYAVYYKTSEEAAYTRVEVPGGESVAVIPAQGEKTYQVYMTACYEEAGVLREGPACAVQSIYAYWAPEMATPVLTLASDYNGKTTVIWDNVEHATGVEVCYRKTTETEYTTAKVDFTQESDRAEMLLLLEPETAYQIYLVAYHEHKGQVYATKNSTTLKITTLGGPTMAAPTLTLTLGDKYNINLSWTAVENANGYSIFYKTDAENAYTNMKVAGDVTSHILPVTKGESYTVYVRGIYVDEVAGVTNSGVKSANKSLWANWAQYRALLIGQTYPGTDSELPGPDVDARAVRTMLSAMSATAYQTTVKLNLTADGILAAIASTFAGADDDTVSLFYYSGHGVNNYGGSLQGALCGTTGYVTVSQLKAALDKIPGTKIVLLDSCHSGAHIGKSVSAYGLTAVTKDEMASFNSSVIAAFSARKKDLGTATNLATDRYYVITASHSQETSLSMGIQGGKYVGAFTHALLYGSGYDEWNDKKFSSLYADVDGNKRISLHEAYTYAYNGVVNGLSVLPGSDSQHVQVYPENSSFVLWGK